MGANQSNPTRKITVVNDEATGVIKISDAVVQRLKGEISGESTQEKPNTPPPPPSPRSSAPAPTSTAPPPPLEELPPPPPSVAVPPGPAAQLAPAPGEHHVWQRPIIQYIEEPSLSALRVKQEKEEEMKKLEEYWQTRLRKQQDEHSSMAKLSEEEFNSGIKKVETLFTPGGARSICREQSDAVRDCYKNNKGQTLRCRDAVKVFVNCVSLAQRDNFPTGG